jgi:hypothetical protein
MAGGEMKLLIRRIIGLISRIRYKDQHWCRRCGRTRNVCKSHKTNIVFKIGGIIHDADISVLCEDCWNDLAPIQRMTYYMQLLNDFEKAVITNSPLIKRDGKPIDLLKSISILRPLVIESLIDREEKENGNEN